MAFRIRSLTFLLSGGLAAGSSLGGAGDAPVDTQRFPKLVRLLLLPEEAVGPEGPARRNGPPRVPADLLGPPRSRARPPRPTSCVRTGRRPSTGPTSSSPGPSARGSRDGMRPGLPAPGRPAGGHRPGRAGLRRAPPRGGHRARPGRDDVPHGQGRTAAPGDMDLPRSARTRPFCSPGGELRIAFDAECRFAEGGLVLDDLRRVARARRGSPRDRPSASGPTATCAPRGRARGTAPARSTS